ncbi:hypothetical protein CEXT_584201 [Caerostris extrusa]|uniref:Uncharacterized protein n=1 Tax=Caerostris extrusa TaxID=172846 RepID=A0AAV4T6T2_CAEEX|nr:hypothetical protein CEXT_584201 [Caerostris extrusa]
MLLNKSFFSGSQKPLFKTFYKRFICRGLLGVLLRLISYLHMSPEIYTVVESIPYRWEEDGFKISLHVLVMYYPYCLKICLMLSVPVRSSYKSSAEQLDIKRQCDNYLQKRRLHLNKHMRYSEKIAPHATSTTYELPFMELPTATYRITPYYCPKLPNTAIHGGRKTNKQPINKTPAWIRSLNRRGDFRLVSNDNDVCSMYSKDFREGTWKTRSLSRETIYLPAKKDE